MMANPPIHISLEMTAEEWVAFADLIEVNEGFDDIAQHIRLRVAGHNLDRAAWEALSERNERNWPDGDSNIPGVDRS